jgi:hypothetical protein
LLGFLRWDRQRYLLGIPERRIEIIRRGKLILPDFQVVRLVERLFLQVVVLIDGFGRIANNDAASGPFFERRLCGTTFLRNERISEGLEGFETVKRRLLIVEGFERADLVWKT